jgi:hypothetical protein
MSQPGGGLFVGALSENFLAHMSDFVPTIVQSKTNFERPKFIQMGGVPPWEQHEDRTRSFYRWPGRAA